MFEENQFYWFIGWGIFAVVTMVISVIVSQNLPQKRKFELRRKFACAVLIPYIFWLFITIPFVSSYSRTDTSLFDEQQTETVFDSANNPERQSRQIQALKVEFERLRNDARNVSEHSRAVMQFLFIIGVAYGINFIFKKTGEKAGEK